MTMPTGQQGAMPDTCYEAPMAEGDVVSAADISAAAAEAVDAAISQRQSTGRDVGM